jgi:hypothetical protein
MAPWGMTLEERIAEIEDAVVRLSCIVELRSGPYSKHGNARVEHEGGLVRGWVESPETQRGACEG